MEALTFDKMPEAVGQILLRLEAIERSLQQNTESLAPVSDRIFDPADAAKFLKISKARVYTKYSRGELPGMKFGNRLHFSEKDLIALLKLGRRKTIAEIALEADSYLTKSKRGLR